MLFHLVRKELLDQLLSLRFAIACVLCSVALMLSAVVQARDYREAVSTFNMNTVVHRDAVLQKDDIAELQRGIEIDRPPNAMNTLVRGLAPQLTESVEVRGGGQLKFVQAYERNPVIPLFPSVDFVFIVGVIMSLLALAFSYDAVSGEQESGVLKLLMSYALPRDTVILGKWIGGYVALVAPFLLAFVAALTIGAFFPEVEYGLNEVLAILGLLALALLYLAAIYSLGLLVSTLTQLASTSIAVLLLLWVALILAVPNMVIYATGQVVRVPSRESVDREGGQLREEGRLKAEAIQKAEGASWDNEEWSEELRAEIAALNREVEVAIQKREESYLVQVRNQSSWSGIAARLSPLTSFNMAAYDIAADGMEQERRFVAALQGYSQVWGAYVEGRETAWRDLVEHRRDQGEQDGRFQRALKFGDYPRFKFEYMSFADRLELIWLDVVLLLIWAALFLMASYISFLRYNIH